MFSNYRITKTRTTGNFMERTGRFTYYEDVYGRRNRDEFDEGPIDRCYPDDDTDEERCERKPPRDRFFRRFATPRSKLRGAESFGEIRAPGKRRSHFNNNQSPASPGQETSTTPTNPHPKPLPLRPSTTKTSKKLLPKKKYGMFSAPTAIMQAPSSAGEALDDMGFDGGFQTMDFDSGNEEEEDMRPDTPISPPDQLRPNSYLGGGFLMSGALDQSDGELMPEAGGEMDRGGGRGGHGPGRPVALMSPSDGDADESRSEAKQIAASNRSKMTARAASMREKARKLPVDKKAAEDDYFRTVYGRKSKWDSKKKVDTMGDEEGDSGTVNGRKPRAGKVGRVDGDQGMEEYYRAVYGRKRKTQEEREIADVAPAEAKAIEERAGWVEVSRDEGVVVEEYGRVN